MGQNNKKNMLTLTCGAIFEGFCTICGNQKVRLPRWTIDCTNRFVDIFQTCFAATKYARSHSNHMIHNFYHLCVTAQQFRFGRYERMENLQPNASAQLQTETMSFQTELVAYNLWRGQDINVTWFFSPFHLWLGDLAHCMHNWTPVHLLRFLLGNKHHTRDSLRYIVEGRMHNKPMW